MPSAPFWRKSCRVLLCIALALLCITAPCRAEQHGTRQVLLLSDVHFSPMSVFKDCADAPTHARFADLVRKPAEDWTPEDLIYQKGLGSYGRDSSFPLLQSALQAAHQALPRPALIVVSGDFVVHHLDHAFEVCYGNLGHKSDDAAGQQAYRDFTAKTITFVLLEIVRTWPGVQVIAALGNNDSDMGDYVLPSSELLRQVMPVWKSAAGFAAKDGGDSFDKTFAEAGYFSGTVRGFDHAEAIVINSNLWTGRAVAGDRGRGDAAAAQLEWLKRELASAAEHKRNVLLVGHVPPGLDAFASKLAHSVETMYAGCNPGSHGCTDYSEAIPRLISAQAGTLRLVVFGHTHMNDFRMDGGVPVLIAPSISPIVQNNPAFVVLTTDAQLRPQDAVTWYLPLSAKPPEWQREFDFRTAYGLPDMSAESLGKLDQKLADDLPLRHTFFNYFASESTEALVPDKWQEPYLCAIRHLTPEGVTPCLLGALGLPF